MTCKCWFAIDKIAVLSLQNKKSYFLLFIFLHNGIFAIYIDKKLTLKLKKR